MAIPSPKSNGTEVAYTYKSDQLVVALLPLRKDPEQNVSRLFRLPAGDVVSPFYVGSGRFFGIMVLQQAASYKESDCHVNSSFNVWVNDPSNGERHQEKRALDFTFNENVDKETRHRAAESFFLQATMAAGHDAVEFLMNLLVIFRDSSYAAHIHHIDVKVDRLADHQHLVVPTAQDCKADEEVEDLLQGHVQSALEYAYPNSLTFDSLVEALRAPPEVVEDFLNDLIEKKIVEQLESGEYIRVNQAAKTIEESKLHKSLTEKPPTIAIITSLFLENLSVSRVVENANSLHMYNLNGDSNIYTIGNIGNHRVVVTKLSVIGDSREATISAGSITTRLLGNFQHVEHVLIVGVGGGVPSWTDPDQHVRLGDVVISSTRGGKGSAYVYGHDVVKKNGQITGVTTRRWNPKQETFIDLLHKNGDRIQKKWLENVDDLVHKINGENTEKLDFTRPSSELDCIPLETGVVVAHPNASRLHPAFHEGTVASMMHYTAPLDDSIPRIPQPTPQELRHGFMKQCGAKAYDAGFDSVIASIVGNCINSYAVIRGVADYHNGSSKVARPWQPFASVTAAAFAKVLIESLPSKDK
ncbi:SAM-MT-ERG6-SMT domain-containing protein [Aphelenchoides fujianensis]|nr:SAM-MT-ERG6-SMT domain-containing protein [Aphelenchoides fujianensis]